MTEEGRYLMPLGLTRNRTWFERFKSISLTCISLVTASSFLVIPAYSSENDDIRKRCAVWFSRLPSTTHEEFGKTFEVRRLEPFIFNSTLPRFGNRQTPEAFLGISDLHYYLYANGRVLDGEVLGRVASTETSEIMEGYLIHFPGLSSETIQSLKDGAVQMEGKRYLSCVQAAFDCLDVHAGIRIGDRKPTLLASTTFERMLKYGFVDSEGNPVPYQIYRYDDPKRTPSRSLWGEGDPILEQQAKRIRRNEVIEGTYYFIVASSVGASAYGVYLIVSDDTPRFRKSGKGAK